jgi:hypothetical protein
LSHANMLALLSQKLLSIGCVGCCCTRMHAHARTLGLRHREQASMRRVHCSLLGVSLRLEDVVCHIVFSWLYTNACDAASSPTTTERRAGSPMQAMASPPSAVETRADVFLSDRCLKASTASAVYPQTSGMTKK